MNKEEYFDIVLKRDFINYVLHKAPEYSADEIAAKLKTKIDSELLYKTLTSHIPPCSTSICRLKG